MKRIPISVACLGIIAAIIFYGSVSEAKDPRPEAIDTVVHPDGSKEYTLIPEAAANVEFTVSANDEHIKNPPEFRLHGYKLSEYPKKLGWWEEFGYNRAIKRFPTVKECLKPSGITPDFLDLMEVDWGKLKNIKSRKICLNRIAAALKTPQRAVAWFDQIGFRTSIELYEEGHWREGEADIRAGWPNPGEGEALISPNNDVFYNYNLLVDVYSGFRVTISYTKDFEPSHIQFIRNFM